MGVRYDVFDLLSIPSICIYTCVYSLAYGAYVESWKFLHDENFPRHAIQILLFSFLKHAHARKASLEGGISHVTLIIYLKRVPLCLKKGDGFIIPDSAIEVSLWIIQNLHGI